MLVLHVAANVGQGGSMGMEDEMAVQLLAYAAYML